MNDQQIFQSNFAEIENGYRELKSELYMKRNEVSKLKTELEQANQENNKLTASLEEVKKKFEINEITIDLYMKKCTEFEPKYYEKRNALIKLELQYKMETSKTDVLRQDLQNITMQKAQLIRKVEVLEEKQKRDSLYSNEISQKFIRLKNTIGTITEDLERLKTEQNLGATLSQQVDLAQATFQKFQELSKLFQKLKDENAVLEERSLSFNAKYEKLSELIKKNITIKEPDFLSRVLLSQCKKLRTFYKPILEFNNNLLTDLNQNLCEEKVVNLKLIEANEQLNDKLTDLEKQVTVLQTKLNVYEPQLVVEDLDSLELVDVKGEPDDTVIEIVDN